MKPFHPNHYSAGLIYDDSRHFIDHLAPFCSLMGWPLIACESAVADLARTYYPELTVIEADPLQLVLPKNVVSCDTLPLLEQIFDVKERNFFWLPHGNSDKGWKAPFFEGMLERETALVYGQRMIDFMGAKEVFPDLIRIGDFRRHYFLKHRTFYEQFLKEYRGKRNILYAPTWDDSEKNNSFWKAFPFLADSMGEDQLIVKLHPNTLAKFPAEIEVLKGRYEKKGRIAFLEEFPPIHCLLEISSLYLGDMSSIGYDFLALNRPMFFLNPHQRDKERDKGLALFCCGEEIAAEKLHQFLRNSQEHLAKQRKEIYESSFDPIFRWEPIKKTIEEKLR